MNLTEDELLLIDGLKLCGISKGMAAAIFMTAHEKALEMCGYMADHIDATEAELLDKARELRAKLDAGRQGDGAIVSPDEQSN